MAMGEKLANLLVVIQADSSGLQAELKRASGDLKRFGDDLGEVSRGAMLAFSAPLALAGVAAIKAAGEMERVTVAFATMAQSVDVAKAHLEELKKFTLETPFQFEQVAQASRLMQAYGFGMGEVIPKLRVIGDAVFALGGGADVLERVIRSIGEIGTRGRITGEQLRELSRAGIPALRAVADGLGVSMMEAQKRITAGTVDSKLALEAILGYMEDRFSGGMRRQAETVLGTWSNFKDRMFFVLAEVGKQFEGLTKSTLNWATEQLRVAGDVVTHWGEQPKAFKTVEMSVLALGVAMPVLGFAMGGIIRLLGALSGSLALTGVRIAAMGTLAGIAVGSLAVLAYGLGEVYRRAKELYGLKPPANLVPSASGKVTTYQKGVAVRTGLSAGEASLLNAYNQVFYAGEEVIEMNKELEKSRIRSTSSAMGMFNPVIMGTRSFFGKKPNLRVENPSQQAFLRDQENAAAMKAADQEKADELFRKVNNEKIKAQNEFVAALGTLGLGAGAKMDNAMATVTKNMIQGKMTLGEYNIALGVYNQWMKENNVLEHLEGDSLDVANKAMKEAMKTAIDMVLATGELPPILTTVVSEFADKLPKGIQMVIDMNAPDYINAIGEKAIGAAAATGYLGDAAFYVGGAFDKLGIVSASALKKAALEARAAAKAILEDVNSKYTDRVRAVQAATEKEIAAGAELSDASIRQYVRMDNAVKTHTQKVLDMYTEVDRTVKRSFDHLARSMADSIVNWKGWGNAALEVARDLAKSFLEIMIQQLLEPLKKEFANWSVWLAQHMKDVLGTVIGVVKKIFGIGNAAASGSYAGIAGAIPGLDSGNTVQAGKDVWDKVFGKGGETAAGTADKVGSSAGSVTSSVASSLGSVMNIVTGAISAVTGVISSIYAIRQEGTLNAVEKETRESKLHLLAILNKINEYLPALREIHLWNWEYLLPTLRDIRQAVSESFKLNINMTSTTDQTQKFMDALTARISGSDWTMADSFLNMQSSLRTINDSIRIGTETVFNVIRTYGETMTGQLRGLQRSTIEKVAGIVGNIGGLIGGGVGGVVGGMVGGLISGIASAFKGGGSANDSSRIEENTRFLNTNFGYFFQSWLQYGPALAGLMDYMWSFQAPTLTSLLAASEGRTMSVGTVNLSINNPTFVNTDKKLVDSIMTEVISRLRGLGAAI